MPHKLPKNLTEAGDKAFAKHFGIGNCSRVALDAVYAAIAEEFAANPPYPTENQCKDIQRDVGTGIRAVIAEAMRRCFAVEPEFDPEKVEPLDVHIGPSSVRRKVYTKEQYDALLADWKRLKSQAPGR